MGLTDSDYSKSQWKCKSDSMLFPLTSIRTKNDADKVVLTNLTLCDFTILQIILNTSVLFMRKPWENLKMSCFHTTAFRLLVSPHLQKMTNKVLIHHSPHLESPLVALATPQRQQDSSDSCQETVRHVIPVKRVIAALLFWYKLKKPDITCWPLSLKVLGKWMFLLVDRATLPTSPLSRFCVKLS